VSPAVAAIAITFTHDAAFRKGWFRIQAGNIDFDIFNPRVGNGTGNRSKWSMI
jgi:hypothetical protein